MNQQEKLAKACGGATEAIREAEGKALIAYPDLVDEKALIVGWGHKVLPEDNLFLGDPIDHERAEAFLKQDMGIAMRAVQRWYGMDIDRMCAARIAVLIEMAFVLGGKGLYGFGGMAGAIKDGNWALAGCEIQNSTWYWTQGVAEKNPGIVTRVKRLKDQMASGAWQ